VTRPPVLQREIPAQQREVAAVGLPKMQQVAPGEWLWVDEAYEAQLAEKVRLLRKREADVLALMPEAQDVAAELLTVVLAEIAMRPDFTLEAGGIRRPDWKLVDPDPRRPLQTLAALVQEDFCLLMKEGDEHVLKGALLCFPASWTLTEKIGRPLLRIHAPVPEYDPSIAARVQRLFDGVQPGRPMWRANLLEYQDPALHHPRREGEGARDTSGAPQYERSERQTVLKLPGTGAVVFSIHTAIARKKAG